MVVLQARAVVVVVRCEGRGKRKEERGKVKDYRLKTKD